MNAPTPQQILDQAERRQPTASQATNIEQSRAVAEVQAMVLVAQRAPRNESVAMKKALDSCSQYAVASNAFYRFPRGGQQVTGESISLAVELARCWGNINYGIMELARDDALHHTEMLAFAWDLETNTRSTQTFIVPHKRDKRGGAELLTDMRDIYENNANNGARRLRECIFRVLPPYLKEAAKARCLETIEKGETGAPLPVRIASGIQAFSDIGIALPRLEARLGPSANWTAIDVAQMLVIYNSIRRGECTAADEFPTDRADAVRGVEQEIRGAVADASRSRRRKADEPKQDEQPPVDEELAKDAEFLRTDLKGDDAPADTATDDNPTAAEGRSDEEHGDQHDGTDQAGEHDLSPAEREIRKQIGMCERAVTEEHVAAVQSRFAKHESAFDTDQITRLNTALTAAKARISQTK